MDCWVAISATVLSAMFLRAEDPTRSLSWKRLKLSPNPVQVSCLASLRQRLTAFFSCRSPDVSGLDDLMAKLEAGASDYGGTMCIARSLTAELIVLPPAAEAASVEALALVPNEMRPYLEDPSLCFRPESEWPAAPPKAPVWAAPADWITIVERLYALGMVQGVRSEDVFAVKGKKVLNGAFGVDKVKPEGMRLRFIANMVINKYLMRFSEESSTLMHPAHFSVVVLRSGEILLVDEEDEANCFYVYRLPAAWAPYFCFSRSVPGASVGLPQCAQAYAGLIVVPMGWLMACDIIQGIERKLAIDAGLPARAEILPTAFLPPMRSAEAWANYIDNFYAIRITSDPDEVGTCGELVRLIRARKRELGIPLNEGKRQEGAVEGKRLGAWLDGSEGWVGLKREERQLLMQVTLLVVVRSLSGFRPPSRLFLQRLVGRLTYGLQFARHLFPCFSAVYQACLPGQHVLDSVLNEGRLSAYLEELLFVALLFPLAESNLRRSVSNIISVTDASLWGGAGGHSVASPDELLRLVNQAEFRGAAVRLGEEPSRRMRPLASFPCTGRRWRVDHFYPWESPDHITMLEGQAYFLYLRRMVRSGISNRRFLHVFDSFSFAMALAKGRSSARRMNGLLRRIGSLQLFAALTPMPLWTDTQQMPMDYASRIHAPRKAARGNNAGCSAKHD